MAEKVETRDVVVALGAAALLGAGLYFGLRKPPRVKRAGDRVEAAISFQGRGPAPAIYQVGFGVAPARLVFHADIVQFYVGKFALELGSQWQTFGPFKVGGNLPQVITPGYNNKLDVWLFIQTETGELRPDAKGFLEGSHWVDNVYELEE